MSIKNDLVVEEGGRTWYLYSVDFGSPDGKYSVYLYAVSDDHAHLQIEALKETATFSGRILSVEKA